MFEIIHYIKTYFAASEDVSGTKIESAESNNNSRIPSFLPTFYRSPNSSPEPTPNANPNNTWAFNSNGGFILACCFVTVTFTFATKQQSQSGVTLSGRLRTLNQLHHSVLIC